MRRLYGNDCEANCSISRTLVANSDRINLDSRPAFRVGGTMFGWFKIKSPLAEDQRLWINQRFEWLRATFGDRPLRSNVVTPTDAYFPDSYAGTEDDAEALFNQVCRYMDVDRGRIDLRFYTSASSDVVRRAFNPELQRPYALGAFQQEGERIEIWLETNELKDPSAVIATAAHELGHVHLLADGRYDASQPDHEPLTDLLTVYFGLGVFVGNDVVSEVNWRAGNFSGWSMSKRGYLSLPEYAYALALYAFVRDENRPEWAAYLRNDVRALFGAELKELVSTGGPTGVAIASCRDTDVTGDNSRSTLGEVDDEEVATDPAEPQDESDEPDGSLDLSAADDFFSEGVALAADGDHEQAIEAYSDALRENPRDAEIWLHRAQAMLVVERYQQAIDDSTESLRLDPDDASAACCRAEALLRLRKFSDALPDLEFAIRDDAKHPHAWYFRSVAHLGLGNADEALRALKYAVRYAPSWAEVYLLRSCANAAMGNSGRAEADLAEAIRRDPKLADSYERARRLPGIDATR